MEGGGRRGGRPDGRPMAGKGLQEMPRRLWGGGAAGRCTQYYEQLCCKCCCSAANEIRNFDLSGGCSVGKALAGTGSGSGTRTRVWCWSCWSPFSGLGTRSID
jgi:hypothetical protein